MHSSAGNSLTSIRQGRQNEYLAAAGRELQDSAVALDEVRAALQQPEFDFNLNYLQGTTLPIQHLTTVRGAAQTIYIHAAAHERKLDLAYKDLQAQLALCRTLENEPVMALPDGPHRLYELRLKDHLERCSRRRSDAQLSDLHRRWERLHFLEPCAASLGKGTSDDAADD